MFIVRMELLNVHLNNTGNGNVMRRATLALGWVAIVMGIVHIFFVLPITDFRLGQLWFIGSGIAIVFAGFINILGQDNQNNKTSIVMVILSNFTMCFLFISATFVLREPQVYVGIGLFAALSVLTVLSKRTNVSK